ncbi:unnamed protein product [Brassica napus]|uniref:(rape) hypothetical protein n=1 Tax=Brassica napus TaxID=3708 RepID=A0A816N0C2_BRANA|nr:unnamed protein product [Brassica napus]
MLFNPEEKDKLYKTQLDLGLEFANSSCIKTFGSWLLMQNLQLNLYIVNLFTHEMITLPLVESLLGMTEVERILDNEFRIKSNNGHMSTKICTYDLLCSGLTRKQKIM